jgi:hypothetical protein
MSSLIELASEFLDRIGNPAYGAQINEEYAIRLTALLGIDTPEIDRRFATEVAALDDVEALTPTGWLWVLRWARAHDVRMSPDLLRALVERWEATSFKAVAIETAIADADDAERSETWLAGLVDRAVRTEITGDTTRPRDFGGDEPDRNQKSIRPPSERRGSRHAYSLFLALVACDTAATTNAASDLVGRDWDGAEDLVLSVWARLDSLDDESRDVWLSRLQIPARPSDPGTL